MIVGICCNNDVMGLLHDPNEVAVLVFPHEKAVELEDGLRLAEERCKSNNIDISNNDINIHRRYVQICKGDGKMYRFG